MEFHGVSDKIQKRFQNLMNMNYNYFDILQFSLIKGL